MFNRRMALSDKHSVWIPRVYLSKTTRPGSARMLVKCGCCDQSVEIWHSDGTIEINGVIASPAEWKKILFPPLLEAREEPCTRRQKAARRRTPAPRPPR
jgi:hypothetical protein